MSEAPLTSFRLSCENLKQRPLRSVGLALVVGLFAFTLFGGSVLNESLRRGLDSMGKRLGADILLVPYGYEKNMEGALLRGEPSTFYLKEGLTEKVREIPGVESVSPQLFLASLNAGCCTAKVQLIGYDPATDFVVRPWMTDAPPAALRDDEVVVGSKIIPGAGEEVTFFSRTFRVAAKLDRTGMGFDTSVFMTIPAARSLMKAAELISGDAEEAGAFVSSVVVGVQRGHEPRDVTNAIFRAYATEWNLDAVVTKSMVSDISLRLLSFSRLIYGISCVLWVMATTVLLLVFSVSLNERRREFALLRIIGASRGRLVKLVLTESLLIGLAGAFTGTAAAAVLLFAFGPLIFDSIGLPYLQLSMASVAVFAARSFGLSALTGPLACAWSALRIAKNDVYSALREGE